MNLNLPFTDICYDSRKVTPGSLFVAVNGYAEAALAGGALAVVNLQGKPGREVLAAAAANFYGNPAERLTLVGVTGTNGKSTVTTLCKQAYERVTGRKAGLIGTIENLVGSDVVPAVNTTPEAPELHALFKQMVDAGCSAVFMEVSSHALELGRVSGLRFAVGAFTNFTQDHLDFHGTMDAYLAAKLKLADMSERFVIDKRISLPYTVSGAVTADGADNYAVALEICKALGLDAEQSRAALAAAVPPRGRFERVPLPDAPFEVYIDFAHTPDALEHVLTYARKRTTSRLIVLFGCGGDRDPLKRPVMGEIAARLADFAVITSDNPRTEDPGKIIVGIVAGVAGGDCANYTKIENRRDAIAYALGMAGPGDIVILAGKGHEPYQIVEKEKYPFDEREITLELYNKQK